MPKAESRIPEKQREYQGEKNAEALVNWLNAPHVEEAAKKRIRTVVGLFLQLWMHKGQMKDSTFQGKDGYWYESHTPDTKKRDDLKKELDKALSYYRMIPSVLLLEPEGKPREWLVLVSWTPAPGSRMKRNGKSERSEEHTS